MEAHGYPSAHANHSDHANHSCHPRAGYVDVEAALQQASAWHDGGKNATLATLALYQSAGYARFPYGGRPYRGWSSLALGPIGPKCDGGFTVLGEGDARKKVCLSANAAGGASSSRRVLWSIGCNNEFGFEEAAVAHFDWIYVFDCTLPEHRYTLRTQPTPSERAQNVTEAHRLRIVQRLRAKMTFFPVCLAAANATHYVNRTQAREAGRRFETGQERRFGTYAELLALTGEARGPAFVKMDIEGWEWSVLHAMAGAVEQGGAAWPPHLRPMQIGFEMHLLDMIRPATPAPEMPFCPRPHTTCAKPGADVDRLLTALFHAGFLLVSAERTSCAHCMEVVVARVCVAHAAAANNNNKASVDEGPLLEDS